MESEQKCEAQSANPSLVMKILTVVVDEDRIDKVTAYLRDNYVRLQYACLGRGTANSEILDMLGLDGSEKTLLFCLLPDFHADALLKTMLDKLHLEKHGHGIAFTMPLSGIGRPILNIFNNETLSKLSEVLPHELTPDAVRERIDQYMESEAERINEEAVRHDLIVAVVNQDYADELVETAKTAGARGGTVINARRTGLDDGNTFLGMHVQAQKDIILILTDRKQKMAIMKAISHEYGLSTDARGLVFSLPVDSVAGLRADR